VASGAVFGVRAVKKYNLVAHVSRISKQVLLLGDSFSARQPFSSDLRIPSVVKAAEPRG
jgi:hypothetical protein